MAEPSRIIVAEGAWAAEAAIVAEIERRLPPGTIPAAPVCVLVPSRSLREHLLGRLATRRAAWLGLEISTLAGLAAGILERCGPVLAHGESLIPIILRRVAALERALAGPLGPLADGYDEIGGAVRDLLDAGFVEEHLEAVHERLELERTTVGTAAVDRAAAIVRVAAGVRSELAARGLTTPADVLAAAARRLSEVPEAALPAEAVLVHGFADLTGVGSDLVEALVRHRPTTVVFDSPPDLDGRTVEWRFGRRLRERLAGLAPVERLVAAGCPTPARVFAAADPAREARAAVGWLAARAGSTRWEECALVARDGGADVAAWVRELDRQAVPFSAESGPRAARGRRAAGIVELLARGADAPLGVAVAVAGERLETATGALAADLRLAFALLGARTLGAAARLPHPARAIVLPQTDRLESTETGGAMLRREVPAEALAGAARHLAALLAGLESMSAPRSLGERVAQFSRWIEASLPLAEWAALLEPLESLGDGPRAAFALDADEWRRLLDATWSESAAAPLGAGAGAALLSVTGARGRTFERLALVGMTRDRFPRPVKSDPLLPDALRLRLRELLPDLPVKMEGHDEERFLFAQLAAAARELALFRPIADGQGRPLPPSPLLDELLRGNGGTATTAPAPPRRSALDVAILTALTADFEGLAPALAAAVEESRSRFGDRSAVDAARLVAARLGLLARRSGDPAEPGAARLGPYLGAVGAVAKIDPRRRPPSVTALERLAGCGWRLFLERVLKLAPLPELVDALPSLPARLAGNVVHRVLEQMLPAASGLPLAAAMAGPPLDCAWPEPALLARRLHAAARRELGEEGLDPALFEATLVREAEILLAAARAHDWPDGDRELLAVEAEGEAEIFLAGAARRIPFRVDRLERRDGELLLTDYKTGRPISTGVQPATRARHLAAKIASGEALQLPVYLLGAAHAAARARYLYLGPDLEERVRELTLAPAELAGQPIAATLEALFASWDAGAFVPRLLERDLRTTFPGCAHCDVREACVQGDSAARQRQARWAGAMSGSTGWELAARAWWELRLSPRRSGGGEAS